MPWQNTERLARHAGFVLRVTRDAFPGSREVSMKVWLRALIGIVVSALPIIGVVGQAPSAYADIPQPDSAPTVISVAVYRNLLEDGDTLFRIYENTYYANTTNISSVDIAYLWSLWGPSGLVGSNVAYPYNNLGYGYNVVSLYFDNTTAITWGSANYTIQLSGTEVAFESPPVWSFSILSEAWSTDNTQALEQEALTRDVLALSAELDRHWGNNASTSLLFQSEIGPVLSQQGMYFWNGAIPGLQGMAPNAYQIVVGDINTDVPTWSGNYTTELGSQWASDNSTAWLANAQQGGADFFNLDWDLLSVILVLIGGLALGIASIALTGDAWNGLVDVSVWMIITVRLGLYGMAFLGLICAIGLIYIALKLWGLR